MFSEITQISLLGVLAVTVVNFFIGGIYFGVVIAKPYLVAMGRQNEEKQKPSGLMIAGPAVCGLFMTLTNALLLSMAGIQTIPDAIAFGALIAIGYLIPMTMTVAINPNFPRPFFYTLINAPYFLITNILACALLVAFG